MFTGIVEEKGEVVSCLEAEGSWKLKVSVGRIRDDIKIGDSVAVNGCCLTAIEIGETSLTFDLLEETRRQTNLRDAFPESLVNLERSLRFDGRVGGHFLTGHVDGQGHLLAIEPDGKDVVMRIEAPKQFEQYLVYKGCIGVDGISLTVARVAGNEFTIWLIPHTMEVTNLNQRKPGDRLNLEFDLLAKYTERILAGKESGQSSIAV